MLKLETQYRSLLRHFIVAVAIVCSTAGFVNNVAAVFKPGENNNVTPGEVRQNQETAISPAIDAVTTPEGGVIKENNATLQTSESDRLSSKESARVDLITLIGILVIVVSTALIVFMNKNKLFKQKKRSRKNK